MCLTGCVELGMTLWGGKVTTKTPKSNPFIPTQNLPVDPKALQFLNLCLEEMIMIIISDF